MINDTTTTKESNAAKQKTGGGWMRRLVSSLFPRWEIREQMMGGKKYWMIYRVWLGGECFFERWNTPETSKIRLDELNSR
jgi:hypothetical protein